MSFRSQNCREHYVELINLTPTFAFQVMRSLPTLAGPISLNGDLVALCNYSSRTTLWNWSTSSYAVLNEDLPAEGDGLGQTTRSRSVDILDNRGRHLYDDDEMRSFPIQVELDTAHGSVLVGRALALTMFAMPTVWYHTLPEAEALATGYLAKHYFGFLDAICFTSNSTSYHILVRGYSDDAGKGQYPHFLRVYRLPPNDDPASILPYTFPPIEQATIPTKRGRLCCTDTFLGKKGVAMWVQPRPWRGYEEGCVADRDSFSLVDFRRAEIGWEPPEKECLYAAILPGSAYRHLDEAEMSDLRRA